MRTLRYVLSALIGLLIALGILIPAASMAAPALGREIFAIRGHSMSPTIPMGAAILVSERDIADVRPGDIVTWQSPNGAYVTHRVLQVVEENGELLLQTKGDANDSPDPSAIPAHAFVGIVDGWVPAAGYGMILMSTPTGLVSWLSFGLALLATDTYLASVVAESQPADGSRRQRRGDPGRPRPQGGGFRSLLTGRRGTGWPVHFEGVTLSGTEDASVFDDLVRCANGDHRRCVTEVRPVACAVTAQPRATQELDRCAV